MSDRDPPVAAVSTAGARTAFASGMDMACLETLDQLESYAATMVLVHGPAFPGQPHLSEAYTAYSAALDATDVDTKRHHLRVGIAANKRSIAAIEQHRTGVRSRVRRFLRLFTPTR
jgi:hypothetical protein